MESLSSCKRDYPLAEFINSDNAHRIRLFSSIFGFQSCNSSFCWIEWKLAHNRMLLWPNFDQLSL